MKIKSRPEDFIVEEKLAVELEPDGNYEIYLLTKRGTNTIDAIKDIARRLQISPKEIGYCGLKDRHSVAKQYISLPKGKGREMTAKNYTLKFAGYLNESLHPALLLENRFHITVRDVSTVPKLVEKEMEDVNKHGLPNYYDAQRFGSARHGKGFVALEVLKKNYRKALKLLLAEHSTFDPSNIKKFKRCINENWGHFERCIDLAPEGWVKRILNFLAHRELSNSTAKKALGMVDDFTQNILINAFQSYLWNMALAEIVTKDIPPENLFYIKIFDRKFPFYKNFAWKPSVNELPTPSPRLKLEGSVKEAYQKVLSEIGIPSIENLRSTVRGWIFKSHRRQTKIMPKISYSYSFDEGRPGKYVWVLDFSLPSGSYATLVLKRVFYREN
ncbi:tRNA pseudouridine13 synthase [Thermosulfidibacter takaii ABI70S6]|uniref:tRNA pseudouridine13 synthase n=1 Tax=Thermosulfidibacter takaii (strain DSM 17441 / JCM 13301 / NBRC 103674 / ABI70S6) TaxID=1298851 RepID=A0A0S3QRE4_THET7|nr:tRNA pseudouridine(13) synthase TruD [Thermosulfidibacter takaii]BAT70902.1 tRNA pseudouridine13 synthase [Thermosulfidibacter takaii ABI70S6]